MPATPHVDLNSEATKSNSMTLPNFIGIGAQRAATSWMYQCLIRHPEVFMPRKEVHFFDKHYDRGAEWYSEHFDQAPEVATVKGEFTPNYLADKEAVERMARLCPDAKLIVILREPVARAYSAYNLMLSHGRYEGLSFEEAITQDVQLVKQGLYGEQLKFLYQLYAPSRVKIFWHEDIDKHPEDVVQELYRWIGVDETFRPDSLSRRYNLSGLSSIQKRIGAPRLQMALWKSPLGKVYEKLSTSRLADWLRMRLARRQARQSKNFSDDAALRTLFRSDIEKLQSLTGRNLSHWLTPSTS